MMYVYCADTYCDSCGERIAADLRAEGLAPEDPSDEYSYDSDEYPKGPVVEEATDSPDHCASGEDCPERVDLTQYGSIPYLLGAEAVSIGALLSDSLTEHGAAYLAEMLAENHPTPYQRALYAYWREMFADELTEVQA